MQCILLPSATFVLGNFGNIKRHELDRVMLINCIHGSTHMEQDISK